MRKYLILGTMLLYACRMTIAYQTCVYDKNCDPTQFCYKPISQHLGLCLDCWMCCAHPNIFGNCPLQCRCNEITCFFEPCGSGRFCDTDDFCQPCYLCNGIQCGDCVNNVTTSADLSFYQYFTVYNFGDRTLALNDTLSRNIIIEWINRTLVPISDIYSNLILLPSEQRLYVYDLANRLHNLKKINPLCNYSSMNMLEESADNCPCISSIQSNTVLRCPQGYRCSYEAFSDPEFNIYHNPIGHVLKSVCVKCRQGEYCPQGTSTDPVKGEGIEEYTCDKGFFCPNTSQRIACSEGSFCPAGTVSPYPCDMNDLAYTTLSFPRDDQYVYEFLSSKQPFRGNQCPINSTTPSHVCTSGYYCPNASVQITCPSGYFCQSQSIVPRKCPVLAVCPFGSSAPKLNGIPYLFVSFFTILIISIFIGKKIHVCKHAQVNTLKNIIIGNIYDVNPELYELPHPETELKQVLKDICYDNIFINKIQRTDPYIFTYLGLKHVSASTSKTSPPWLWSNNVVFQPQMLNAIIGGSGCGKSTLLDLLRGSLPNSHVTGDVVFRTMQSNTNKTLNLKCLHTFEEWNKLHDIKQIRGYVPQDDVLLSDLTVLENITLSAMLKFSISTSEVNNLVLYVIHHLGLENIKNNVVGNIERRGISGGQRKRVNIGIEIVHLPSLLIMDEPTSGLDATGCQSLTEYLRILSRDFRMTIISVIHQPRYSSFILYDHVILLSKYGTVYEGDPVSGLVYFSLGLEIQLDKNENPADVLMDIVSGKTSFSQEDLVNLWRHGKNGSRSGKDWISECHKVYPLLPHMLKHNITYDDETRKIVDFIFKDITICNINDLHKIAVNLRIPVTNGWCQNIIAHISQKSNVVTSSKLKQYIHEVCSEQYCRGNYINIIDRIALLQYVPRSLISKHSNANSLRQIEIIFKFVHKLLKKCNIELQNNTLQKVDKVITEVMLISMTCKSLVKFTHDRRFIGSLSPTTIMRRKAPNMLVQISILTCRKCILIWRSPWQLQLGIPIITSFIIGNIQGINQDVSALPNNFVYAIVALGVLSMITHVKTFSTEKLVIRREMESKISISPYLLAYAFVDLIWIFAISAVYAIPYYYLTLPRMTFSTMYLVCVMVCWWCSGMSYIISSLPIALPWANLIAVFLALIYGAFLQGLNPTIAESMNAFYGYIIHNSYNRWAMEILTIEEFKKVYYVQPNIVLLTMDRIGLCGFGNVLATDDVVFTWKRISTDISESCQNYVSRAYLWLFGYGTFFRLIASFIMLVNTHPMLSRCIWMVKSWFIQLLKLN